MLPSLSASLTAMSPHCDSITSAVFTDFSLFPSLPKRSCNYLPCFPPEQTGGSNTIPLIILCLFVALPRDRATRDSASLEGHRHSCEGSAVLHVRKHTCLMLRQGGRVPGARSSLLSSPWSYLGDSMENTCKILFLYCRALHVGALGSR